MTGNISPTSQTDLAQRRHRLRRQRRVRLFQMLWRVVAVGGLAGGLVWVSTQPIWLIQKPEQIKIEGNRFLPADTLRAVMPLTYPQSLLQVEPQAIAAHLKTKAPISEAIVSRQLFPPGLTIRVRERYPVAITFLAAKDIQLLAQQSPTELAKTARVGLLDENGMAIPLENYELLKQSVKLPELKVIGSREHFLPHWSNLYQTTRQSPVKITELDFQNPANLVLQTELGVVHLGPYTSRFPAQVKTLDRMRKLPNQIDLKQIAYIDLRSPVSPVLQMKGTASAVKPSMDEVEEEAPEEWQ